jgi:hypothetical protein
MTDSFARLLEDLLADRFSEILVSVPGKIESYDSSTNTASVQPLLQSVKDAKTAKFSIISDVPCSIYYQNGFLINNNYKKGDLVLLSFQAHSTEKALLGQFDSTNNAPFNASNCFVNGSYISKTNINPNRNELLSKDGLIMGHESGDAFIQIKEDEIVFQVGGSTGNKWVLKSDKTEVNKTVEVEQDVIVDSKGQRISGEKHGHSAPFGPTISKIPTGEAA